MLAIICYAVLTVFVVIRLDSSDSRDWVERKHGIKLPESAAHLQTRGDRFYLPGLDHGEATMFEFDSNERESFKKQLSINSTRKPKLKRGDPTVNGYNVWPHMTDSFVPGNEQYGGFEKTWRGEAIPLEMFSCASTKGDFLHVEFWELEGEKTLAKIYTDWN